MDDAERLEFLRRAGLTDPQARVYDALATAGPATPREVAMRAGLARTRAYAVLDALVETGVVRRDAVGFAALPLAPRLDRRAEDASRRHREILVRRDVLAREFDAPPGAPDDHEIRLVRGAHVEEVVMDMLRSTTERVDLVASATTLRRLVDSIAAGGTLRRALERAPASRLVAHATAEDVAALERLPASVLRHVRVAPPPAACDRLVVDGRTLLLRFGTGDVGPGVALATSNPRAVADAEAVVELAWSRATLAVRAIASARGARSPA